MTDTSPRIAILLPTWNGVKFLAEQLDSLLAQTYQNFVVVIRDDGSTDSTAALIAQYAAAHPHHIHVLVTDGQNLGASGSFSCLMSYALQHKQTLGLERAWLMFCDQDDVWVPHKIAVSMQRMQAVQQKHPGAPALTHSDLCVVDEHRHVIAPSFVSYQGLAPLRNTFGRMIVTNTVTGCTALLNEELAILASPVPAEAVMHDWWLALVASAFGHIDYIDEALVEYRQHGKNTIGARAHDKVNTQTFITRLLDNQHDAAFRMTAKQARAYLKKYASTLSVKQRASLRLAMTLFDRNRVVQKSALKILQKL